MEVSHFARYLIKAKARMVEAVFAPESSTLLTTDIWSFLTQNLDKAALIGWWIVFNYFKAI